jgi:hypothetical protein
VRRFIKSYLHRSDYDAGRWDAALRGAEDFIAECEAGEPHYHEAAAHEVRALILLGRDDAEGAATAAARAVELARQVKDPQVLHRRLATQILVDLETGRTASARVTARELLERVARIPGVNEGLYPVATRAEELGVRGEVRALVLEMPPTHRRRVLEAIVSADLAHAAELLAEQGDVTGEAELRLRFAAELATAGRAAEADQHLQRALAFFRSVGATRYVRQGEALLAATA